MFSNFGKRALGLQVIGIVALQACSPGGHSPGEGNVESITSALGVSPGIWRPEGPAPITSCGTSLPFSDCSGAAQQAVVDPTSGAIYLATINGGVFKSTTTTANTIFSNPPSRMQWTPLTDDRPSLSMSALAIDPSNPQSLIAGTGQYSSFGAVGAQGVVYVLANGGATVTTVDDPLLRGQRISALTIRGNLALATTDGNSGGVFCSEDGGLSWSSLLGSQGLPSNIGPAWDLTADPSNANRYYVVVGDQGTGNAGIYLGTHSGSTCKNGGFAWAQISNSDQSARGLQFSLSNAETARLAVSPAGRLYTEVVQFQQPVFISFTSNQGGAFTPMDIPRFTSSDCNGGQASVAIANVTALDDGRVLVTTANAHCLAGAGRGERVNITGVQGLPLLSGDYIPVPFTDSGATSPSNTKVTLQDPVLGSFITATAVTGGPAPAGGTVLGTGGTQVQWEGPNHSTQGGKQAIAADPVDPNVVYVSGDASNEMVVRGDTTIQATGGVPTNQWVSISGNGATGNTGPHADSRHLMFDTSGNLLLVCDGGIYLRKNPRDPAKDAWYDLNGNLQTVEMHDVAFDPVSHGLFGGLQDNGTPSIAVSVGSAIPWAEIEFSDGGDVKAVPVLSTTDARCQPVAGQPICSYRYTETVPAECGAGCFFDFERHLFNSSGVELDQNNGNGPKFVIPPFIDNATSKPMPKADGLFFITPFDVNQQNSNRLVISGNKGVWESLDLGQTVTLLGNSPAGASGFAYGHGNNPEALWVASPGGVFTRFTAGAAMTQAAGFPIVGQPDDGPFSAVAVVMSPYLAQTAFATSRHNVFQTTDGGQSWLPLTGDLSALKQRPNQGPGLLRAITYVPSTTRGDRIFVAAAENGVQGVFMMAVANPGVWTRVGSNLPNALVFDLDYDASRDQLVAGLVGRGAWTIPNATQLDRAPESGCANATVPADATCHFTATPGTFNANASDPDGNAVTITLAPAGPVSLGTTPVTITFTDTHGAASTCNPSLTVVDVTGPVITAPPAVNITSCIDSQALNVGTATASDNCMSPLVTGQVISRNGVALNPPIPVVNGQVNLGPGTFVIRWSASDGINTATATQTVTVAAGIEAGQSFLLDDRSSVKTPGGGFAAVLNAGGGQTKVGQNVKCGGVLSVGPVAVQHRAVVNGNAVSAGTVSKDTDATITGVRTEFATVRLPALPTLPAFPNPTLGTFTVNSGSQSHGPGSYTSATVNGGTLILSGGDYFFQSLTINANVTVRVQPTTRIFVRDALVFQSPLLAAVGTTVQRITLGFAGTTLSMLATFNGTLIAPNATVFFGTDTSLTFTGSFFARVLEVRPDTNLVCSL